VSNEFNGLIKCEEESDLLKLIERIPEEYLFQRNLISCLLYVDNRIVMVPFMAKKIWLYDIRQGTWNGLSIYDSECQQKFLTAIVYAEKVFFIPYRYPGIIVLDLKDDQIEYIKLNSKNDFSLPDKLWYRKDIVRLENHLYMAHLSSDRVMHFDLDKMTYDWIDTPMKCEGFSGISWDGKDFWLSPNKSSDEIYRWNGKSAYEKIPLRDGDNGKIRWITYDGEYLVVQKERRTIYINLSSTDNDPIIQSPVLFYKAYGDAKSILDKKGIYEWRDNKETIVKKFEIKKQDLDLFIKENMNETDKELFGENIIIKEDKIVNLKLFLNMI